MSMVKKSGLNNAFVVAVKMVEWNANSSKRISRRVTH